MTSIELPKPLRRRARTALVALAIVLLVPVAYAQGSPFDNGFTALQTLFTGTIAKVASLIAIVIGGYRLHTANRAARKPLQVAAGTGIAVLAANVLTWLWGV